MVKKKSQIDNNATNQDTIDYALQSEKPNIILDLKWEITHILQSNILSHRKRKSLMCYLGIPNNYNFEGVDIFVE